MAKIRFDKLISDSLGVTRSCARAKIKSGVCFYDGIIITDPAFKAETSVSLAVDGKPVRYRRFVYIMMNKPQGVVSATEDASQKTVLDLLPASFSRFALFPAGRLDIDTEGFLLLTNDGKTAHSLLSPSKKVAKEYFVRLSEPLSEKDRLALERGVDIGGYVTKECKITPLSRCECITQISEGKFHQIKRMFEAVSNSVIYLKRISFASLKLDPALAPGEYRFLTDEEVDIIGGSL